MHVWIDIENPPQVQYLLPFKPAFEAVGADVTVTARDYGFTYELLRERGIDFTPIGASYGRAKWRKLVGVAGRTRALVAHVRRGEKPCALLCAGRASAVAARIMGIPSFELSDYEHADVTLYRATGIHFVFPEVIDPEVFVRAGIKRSRLMPYAGLKEDLTFAGIDVDAVPAHAFDGLPGRDLVRVLFRPPADESHYYVEDSGSVALDALEHLAAREDVVTIFSPRYPRQVELLDRFSWHNPPVVLDRPVPFLSLLKGVDAVISSGGTMLREAAWLGVPAYSIFRGEPGGVDLHLEQVGRLTFISGRDDLAAMRLERGARRPVLSAPTGLVDQLVERILERAGARPDPVPSALAAATNGPLESAARTR